MHSLFICNLFVSYSKWSRWCDCGSSLCSTWSQRSEPYSAQFECSLWCLPVLTVLKRVLNDSWLCIENFATLHNFQVLARRDIVRQQVVQFLHVQFEIVHAYGESTYSKKLHLTQSRHWHIKTSPRRRVE